MVLTQNNSKIVYLVPWVEDKLRFKVHKKPNQQLHCLGSQSLHTRASKRAIPEGACNRLGKLTTMDDTNKNLPVLEVHPEHHQKHQRAGLIKGQHPLHAADE